MLDIDAILRPWWDDVLERHGPIGLYDVHTHIGQNDPDGFKQTPEELMEVMERADARAVVFPMHEPDGYPGPNDVAIAAAAGSDGRLSAFCRIDPEGRRPAAEARRCLDAGAVGIKFHPRAEQFTLAEPGVREVVAVAHERRVPVLIHAGRGIPALGEDTVRLSGEFTDARLILAHAAISDLAWLWRVLPDHPNVFIDTAWWNPADLIALFTLVAPSQILWASDSPYGLPVTSAAAHARCAVQAGLTDDAAALRVRRADGAADRGRGPDLGRRRAGAGAEGATTSSSSACSRTSSRPWAGRSAAATRREPLALARLACAVGEDSPARGRLRRRARAARPVPRPPRAAPAGPPVPGRGPVHHRRDDDRPHAGRAAAAEPPRPAADARRGGRRLQPLAFAAAGHRRALARRGAGRGGAHW